MGYNARCRCSSFRTTPHTALPIASNHLRLQSHSVCIMRVFHCTHHGSVWFSCDLSSMRFWSHYFSYSTTARFKNPSRGKPLLHNTRHTHHDHAHCDSHFTAGCLHRTASSYYLLSVHAQCVREDQNVSCVNSTANRNTRHTNKCCN